MSEFDSGLDVDPAKVINMLNALRACGVGSVLWHVRGSGDSADEGEFQYYSKPDEAKLCIQCWNSEQYAERGVLTEGELLPKLKAAYGEDFDHDIAELCWDALNTHGSGWYNNEGGYGYVWITLAEKSQIGSALFEYPEPEAVETGRASVWGEPLDGTEHPV